MLLTHFLYTKSIFIVWCTVKEERQDGTMTERCVNARFLETELGDPVGPNDLYFGNNVIWRFKGKPYEVSILETHSKE